ncbi:hypothetical protein F5Y04DRAFT_283482 [Hypomontagnella monticulosa]|nr:hypothetical protein F5Y04DRAFT_283482 [Hypomontagnella monticulosa]
MSQGLLSNRPQRTSFSHSNGRKTTADDPYGDNISSNTTSSSNNQQLQPLQPQSTFNRSRFDAPPLFSAPTPRGPFLPSIPEVDSRSSSLSRAASRYLSLIGLESDVASTATPSAAPSEFAYAGKGKCVASSSTLVRSDDTNNGDEVDSVSIPPELPKRVVRRMASRMRLLQDPPAPEQQQQQQHSRLQSLSGSEEIELTAFSFGEFQQWSTDEEPFRLEHPCHSEFDPEESRGGSRHGEARPHIAKKPRTEYRRSITPANLKRQVDRLRDLEYKLEDRIWSWKQRSRIHKFATNSWQKVKRIFMGNRRPARASNVPDWLTTFHENEIEMQDMSRPNDRSEELPDAEGSILDSRSAISIQRGVEPEQVLGGLDDIVARNWLSADRGLQRADTIRESPPSVSERRTLVTDASNTDLEDFDEYYSETTSISVTPPKSGHWLSGRI